MVQSELDLYEVEFLHRHGLSLDNDCKNHMKVKVALRRKVYAKMGIQIGFFGDRLNSFIDCASLIYVPFVIYLIWQFSV
jgi:hypothetical protein